MSYIFFSPHIDDVMLSLGGLIANLLDQSQDVKIEYIFSISNWSNPKSISKLIYGTDVQEISNLRKGEESNIQNNVIPGYKIHYWDLLDAPLREGSSKEEQASLNDQLRKMTASFTDSKDELFFPLGLGHPDHKLVTEQGLWLLKAGCNVRFYEDMPYVATNGLDHWPFFRDHRAFHTNLCLHGLCSVSQVIDPARKFKIINSYSSQIAELWLKDMNNYCYSPKDNAYFERWWTPGMSSITWQGL